jgi:hypothetical protein
LRILACIVWSILLVPVGSVLAMLGTYYGCVLIDYINGRSGGDGMVNVGWIFWIGTVPVGAFTGLTAALYLGLKPKKDNRPTEAG